MISSSPSLCSFLFLAEAHLYFSLHTGGFYHREWKIEPSRSSHIILAPSLLSQLSVVLEMWKFIVIMHYFSHSLFLFVSKERKGEGMRREESHFEFVSIIVRMFNICMHCTVVENKITQRRLCEYIV